MFTKRASGYNLHVPFNTKDCVVYQVVNLFDFACLMFYPKACQDFLMGSDMYQDFVETIIEISKRIYDKGYVAATDGNISFRLDCDRIMTTASGVCKGFLTRDDLVVVGLDGKKLSGKKDPSSELLMHLEVYKQRPDVKAVIHAHPPISTGISIAGLSLSDPVVPEVVITLGEIPTAKYATTGTDEVAESIKDLIKNHDAILLERHGSLTVGDSLESAYMKLEKVEHTAKVVSVAHGIGKVRVLSDDQLEKLKSIRIKYLNNF